METAVLGSRVVLMGGDHDVPVFSSAGAWSDLLDMVNYTVFKSVTCSMNNFAIIYIRPLSSFTPHATLCT